MRGPYILIEHQSEPDRMMPLRLLDYVIQIYRYQEREWKRSHRSTAGLRLQPVLPIVLYTGDRRWDAVGTLADLVQPGAASFQNWMPRLESFFLNTPAVPAEVLGTVGGFLGPVLRLTTAKRARLGAFRKQLVSVIQFLESMPAEERYRWLELLSYIHALVYHVRQPDERPGLWREIEASVATDAHREEASDVSRTIADELKEQASIATACKTLVRQLRRRFGEVPEDTIAVIESTTDLDQLENWLDLVVTAATLEEIGIQ